MNKDLAVTPSAWSSRGEATVNFRGRTIRVWQGIVGEHARVRLVGSGAYQDYATFVEAREDSPYRVQPPCDRYHTCGGCPMMHLNAEGQHRAKTAIVRDALTAQGLDNIEIAPVVVGPDPTKNFRYVVKLGVGYSDYGHLRVGAWGRHTRTVVPIPHCLVATQTLRDVMTSVAHHIIELDIPPYDPLTDQGVIRTIVLRQSRATDDVLITIVVGRRTREVDNLADRLAEECPSVCGVALHINTEEGNAIFSADDEGLVRISSLGGKRFITDDIDGIRLRIDPSAFFQTNPGVAEKLYLRTLELMALDETTPVVDLYCGVGPIALLASRVAGWTHGVELSPTAIDAAREAARAHDLPATFRASDVLSALPDLAAQVAAARPIVSVNPARRGLEEGVPEGIAALHPRRIAYISCHPTALARDLVQFAKLGFHTKRVELFDMFPHTAHVECLALLSSSDDSPPTRRAPRRSKIRNRSSGGHA